MKHSFRVNGTADGWPALRLLTGRIPGVSRERLLVAFHKGYICVNSIPVDEDYVLHRADLVEADLTHLRKAEVFSEKIPLSVLFEDEHVLVLIKPAGMACHAGLGVYRGTLLNALKGYFEEKGEKTISNGLVHRLDRATEGVTVIAKSDLARNGLLSQMAEKSSKREYLVLVQGFPEKAKGIIELPIGRDKDNDRLIRVYPAGGGGKHARTDYLVEKTNGTCSWIRCTIHTGRTHQVRVHMASLGFPLFGDRRYGGPEWPRLMLFAVRLEFTHPSNGDTLKFTYEPYEFRQELPC